MSIHKAIPLGLKLNIKSSLIEPIDVDRNSVWIDTDIPVTNYVLGSTNPIMEMERVEIKGAEIAEAGMKMNNKGVLSADAAWSVTKYYPVGIGPSYYMSFTESGVCGAYYDGNYNFIAPITLSGVYERFLTDVPLQAEYVRFCIRTYTDTNDTESFRYNYSQYINNDITIEKGAVYEYTAKRIDVNGGLT